mgnify:CR=1 FL=1
MRSMGKLEKLIQKILTSNSVITIDEAEKILKHLEFVASDAARSHLTYRKANADSVTLVLTQKELKPYMINKLRKVLKAEGY